MLFQVWPTVASTWVCMQGCGGMMMSDEQPDSEDLFVTVWLATGCWRDPMTDFTSAIVCLLIATVAVMNAVMYIGEWYGFACLMLALAFGTVGLLLWRTP